MPLVERKKVMEWRITVELRNYLVRYWVESDPTFGGVDEATAEAFVLKAHGLASAEAPFGTKKAFAQFLFDRVPPASSVEVCDRSGNGVALHRDWP